MSEIDNLLIYLLTYLHTNKTVTTGPSTETALTGPTKTKPNLVAIVVDLQEWPVIILIDPLEYVVTYLFEGLCQFNN